MADQPDDVVGTGQIAVGGRIDVGRLDHGKRLDVHDQNTQHGKAAQDVERHDTVRLGNRTGLHLKGGVGVHPSTSTSNKRGATASAAMEGSVGQASAVYHHSAVRRASRRRRGLRPVERRLFHWTDPAIRSKMIVLVVGYVRDGLAVRDAWGRVWWALAL